MNVEIAGHAGTVTLKLLNTENIEMFRHPNYYKELRKLRNKLDQAISHANSTRGPSDVRPDPGPKLQAPSESSNKPQASSPVAKASSFKPQASSAKIPEPGYK